MRTSYTSCFLVIVCIVINVSCSSSKNGQQSDLVQQVSWQKDSLFVDGNDGDWNRQLSSLDEKQGLLYSVSNDQNNLYVLIKTQNENSIQRILRGGLTVYINNHGVKEEIGAAGISFPTGNRISKDGRLLNDRPELQQDKHIALNGVADYALFGFHEVKTPENFDYGKPNPEGIELGIGLNSSNALVYEAVVPLSSFLSRADQVNMSRRSFAVGFVLESIPGERNSRGGGSGISIGGGIGLGSFGSGGGVGISIGSDALANIGRRKQDKPLKIWRELLLTKSPAPGK